MLMPHSRQIRAVQELVEHAVVDHGPRLDPVLPFGAVILLVVRVGAGCDVEGGQSPAHPVEDAEDGVQQAG